MECVPALVAGVAVLPRIVVSGFFKVYNGSVKTHDRYDPSRVTLPAIVVTE
jgi:hypothetical protein